MGGVFLAPGGLHAGLHDGVHDLCLDAAGVRESELQTVGLSIDSTYSHIAWLRTIKEKIEYKGMKGVEVNFPVISDLTMEVSKAFGMLQPGASNTQAVRAVFIIDPAGKVRRTART